MHYSYCSHFNASPCFRRIKCEQWKYSDPWERKTHRCCIWDEDHRVFHKGNEFVVQVVAYQFLSTILHPLSLQRFGTIFKFVNGQVMDSWGFLFLLSVVNRSYLEIWKLKELFKAVRNGSLKYFCRRSWCFILYCYRDNRQLQSGPLCPSLHLSSKVSLGESSTIPQRRVCFVPGNPRRISRLRVPFPSSFAGPNLSVMEDVEQKKSISRHQPAYNVPGIQ